MADINIIDPARHYQRQSTRRMAVTDANTAYLFVTSSGNVPGYIKTTDKGVTWSSYTAVTGAGGAGPYDMFYPKNMIPSWAGANFILIAWMSPPGGAAEIFFAVFDVDTETFTTPATIPHHIEGSFNSSGLSCCVSRSGDYWITGTTGFAFSPESPESETLRSTDDGATWTVTVDIGESWRDEVILWPDFASADPDDICAVFCDNSAVELSWKRLDASANTIVSETAVLSSAAIGDGQTDPVIWSSTVTDAGVVYLVSMDNSQVDVSLKTFTITGATVTATTDVISNAAQVSGPYIALDANGTVRVFYGRDTAGASRESQSYFYKASTDAMATWGSETQISDSDGYWISTGVGDPRPRGIVLPVWWDETHTYYTTDSPIEVATALAATIATVFTLTATLTGGTVASPPVVIKCKPISVTQVVNFAVGTMR